VKPEPSVGRIVHVKRGDNPQPMAAIIAKVLPPTSIVNVALIMPSGDTVGRPGIAHESTRTSPEQECWSWPERVDG
jgi:hypothetical protein